MSIASKKNIIRTVLRQDAENVIQIFAQNLADGEYDDEEDEMEIVIETLLDTWMRNYDFCSGQKGLRDAETLALRERVCTFDDGVATSDDDLEELEPDLYEFIDEELTRLQPYMYNRMLNNTNTEENTRHVEEVMRYGKRKTKKY